MTHAAPFCIFLVLCTVTNINAKYTSEETNENSKAQFSAFSSVIGSTENNRQQRTRVYEQPGYYPIPAGSGYAEGSDVSGVIHNGPAVPAHYGSHGTAYGSHSNTKSAAEHSEFSRAVGSRLPQGQTEHNSLVAETDDIGYPRGHISVNDLDPVVSGSGNLDVRTSASPSVYSGQQLNPYPPGYPQNFGGGGGYGNTITGLSNSPSHYPYSPRGAPGYNLHPPAHSPSTPGYPNWNPGTPYVTPHATHDYRPHQPSAQHSHPHYHQPHNGHKGHRGESHLDHSLKLNTEYKEVGHHVGPFQGSTGYGSGHSGGYDGAFNRPIYLRKAYK